MDDISDVYLTDYIPSIYTTPLSLHYKHNGKDRQGDVFAERNGVVIILYNVSKDALVLVKQFRAPVYMQNIPETERHSQFDTMKYPVGLGITLEFCAGLEDKDIQTDKVAQEEILEECGYEVPVDKLERIANICNLSDTTGARSTFYYCEVTEDMRVHGGGGVEGENIELVEMSVEDVVKYASKSYVCSPMNFMFGLQWFLYNKYKKYFFFTVDHC
ncbi:uridine diphosphate glucose pyrophosphatase NUDT14-like [Cylas formicarius]|uniref:uridine diphosphate glucose pyrophosphatase NUDT14-like n=1 Tax=Cylas formicarius TaxID=197179 RepID=UPI002958DD0E|nr:uridine diphosphate glucose pyrophosphatase NUDT14-like [Cylas formicarius]